MSKLIQLNSKATEALPLRDKRRLERELNYGPAVFTLANAAELRKVSVTKCYEGLSVILQFLNDSRDFGGGVFVWKPADETPDNNGTSIIPTDNTSGRGCWRRQESLGQPGFINIKWFGAIPFLPGFDNAPIINAAIQTLPRFAPSFPMPINGGFMRTGICHIPAGEWYVSGTIVASGSMSVRGEGTTATTLTLNNNCPLFDGVPLRMITAYSKEPQMTLGGRPMVWEFPVTRITFSTPHGYAPGQQISGLIEGLVGNDVEYHTNGRWYRFHALNEYQVEFLDYGPTPSSFDGAFVEFEKFILDFQWAEGNVADNDIFGTQCRSLSVVGAALTNNQNARSSGIYILGAQDSLCEDVRVWTTGIRGIHLAVPGNRVGVANIVRGPGIYTTNGYLIKHGTMHSEHVNQQAAHLISDYNNPPVPRAAFMITNCFHARFQHIQGENSPLEVHIRNSSNIYLGDVAMNAAGVNQVFANAYPHTIFHFSGLTRSVTFEGASFTTGTYVHTARDVTEYAKTLGVDGFYENLAECSARTGHSVTSPVHHILLGPYADDTAATTAGVPLGATYKQPGGVITWRTDIAPPSGATPIYNHFAISQVDYDAIVTPDPNTVYHIIP
jgi:hypothetical protein